MQDLYGAPPTHSMPFTDQFADASEDIPKILEQVDDGIHAFVLTDLR